MPSRSIGVSYCSLTGEFSSRKLDRLISWESSLERDLYYLLEFDRSVPIYEEQPNPVIYGSRKYTLDTYVHVSNGKSLIPRLPEGECLLEVKYREDIKKNWASLKPKFKAAIAYCKSRGWKFRILTEKEIRGPALDNIRFLDFFMRRESPLENEFREVLINMMDMLKIATPEMLLAACFDSFNKRAEATPIMWRLLAEGSIGFEMEGKITMKSEIWAM